MTTEEQILRIFSNDYHPSCHPSREDDIKIKEAILILAQKIDVLIEFKQDKP